MEGDVYAWSLLKSIDGSRRKREDVDEVEVVVDDDCANKEELGGGIDEYFTEKG